MIILISIVGSLAIVISWLYAIELSATTSEYINAQEESRNGKDRYNYICELKKQMFAEITLLCFNFSVAVSAFYSISNF